MEVVYPEEPIHKILIFNLLSGFFAPANSFIGEIHVASTAGCLVELLVKSAQSFYARTYALE